MEDQNNETVEVVDAVESKETDQPEQKQSLKEKARTGLSRAGQFVGDKFGFITGKFKKGVRVPVAVATEVVNTASNTVTDTMKNVTNVVADTARDAREKLENVVRKKKEQSASEKLDAKIKMGLAMSNFWLRYKFNEFKGKFVKNLE